MIEEMERERRQKIDTVNKLVHGDIRDVDNKMFSQYKADDILMDEFAKQVLETFYPDDKNA